MIFWSMRNGPYRRDRRTSRGARLQLPGKLVMPGHSCLPCADCVNLSALPGIDVFFAARKAWMAGTSPAMTEKLSRVVRLLAVEDALEGREVPLGRGKPEIEGIAAHFLLGLFHHWLR